jgi:hypothetical protein
MRIIGGRVPSVENFIFINIKPFDTDRISLRRGRKGAPVLHLISICHREWKNLGLFYFVQSDNVERFSRKWYSKYWVLR